VSECRPLHPLILGFSRSPLLGYTLGTPGRVVCLQMIDAWGGWPQFQRLLGACKAVGDRHGVGIAPVGIRYILDQVRHCTVQYSTVQYSTVLFSAEIKCVIL